MDRSRGVYIYLFTPFRRVGAENAHRTDPQIHTQPPNPPTHTALAALSQQHNFGCRVCASLTHQPGRKICAIFAQPIKTRQNKDRLARPTPLFYLISLYPTQNAVLQYNTLEANRILADPLFAEICYDGYFNGMNARMKRVLIVDRFGNRIKGLLASRLSERARNLVLGSCLARSSADHQVP